MPLYDYKCDCGCEFELQQRIAHRKTAECPNCDATAKQIIKSGRSPGISTFQAGWWRDIDLEPTYINNPQELRDALDKHNATAPLLEDGIWRTSPGPDPEHL